MRLLLLFLPSILFSADRTVCASGCTYTSIQTAVDAAANGDRIVLKANETYTEQWSLRTKRDLQFVTDALSSLPRIGQRVNPTDHSALMPNIQPDNLDAMGVIGGNFYVKHGTLGSVDVATDTITASYNYSMPQVGDPIICYGSGVLDPHAANNTDAARYPSGGLPGGITEGQRYWVKTKSSTNYTLTATPGGATLDITSTGGLFRCAIADPPTNITFRGIRFSQKTGQVRGNPLFSVGYEEPSPATWPTNIQFIQCIFGGSASADGPRRGLSVLANGFMLRDSYIYEIKQAGGYESHGLWLQNGTNYLIENNYIEAASLGILVGGYVPITRRNLTNLTLRRNHIKKNPNFLYSSSTSVPTSTPCLPGAYHRKTDTAVSNCTGGGCYTCNSDGLGWTQDTGLLFRSSNYSTKSGLETKNCEGCVIEGNVIQNVFDGPDPGNRQGINLSRVSADQNGRQAVNKHVIIRNNWIDRAWAGISAGNDNDADFDAVDEGPFTIHNNLVTRTGDYPAMSMNWTGGSPGAHRWLLQFFRNEHDVSISMLTGRTVNAGGGSASPPGVNIGWVFAGNPAATLNRFSASGVIIVGGTYQITLDAGDSTCGSSGLGGYVASGSISNIVWYDTTTAAYAACQTNRAQESSMSFVGADQTNILNSRLTAGSTYAAGGSSFENPDGSDLGADVEAIAAATSGVISGSRWPEPRITVGSTRALIEYTAPSASACDLTVYTAPGRISANEHGDTNTVGEKADSRTGNISDGTRRIFVLGTNTALTAATRYYGLLSCESATVLVPFEFRTLAAGAGTYYFTSAGVSATVTYSANADLTSGTTTGSATSQQIPVSSGAVVYFRRGSGATYAAVAP